MQLEEYHKLAEVEDRMWYFHALNRRIGHWLTRTLPAGHAKILDAGCGTGGLLRSLAAESRGWELVGLDFMPLACEFARARTGASIVEGSILELPFADAYFDAIVSCDVICQVDDAERALREFARCVRPGGTVLVNAPAYPWLWSYHDDAVSSKRRFTRVELVAIFRAAGLEPLFSTYANCLVFPLVYGRRKLFPPRQPSSDVTLASRPVEALLGGAAALEFAWQRAGVPSPFGSSVFVVGRRS